MSGHVGLAVWIQAGGLKIGRDAVVHPRLRRGQFEIVPLIGRVSLNGKFDWVDHITDYRFGAERHFGQDWSGRASAQAKNNLACSRSAQVSQVDSEAI